MKERFKLEWNTYLLPSKDEGSRDMTKVHKATHWLAGWLAVLMLEEQDDSWNSSSDQCPGSKVSVMMKRSVVGLLFCYYWRCIVLILRLACRDGTQKRRLKKTRRRREVYLSNLVDSFRDHDIKHNQRRSSLKNHTPSGSTQLLELLHDSICWNGHMQESIYMNGWVSWSHEYNKRHHISGLLYSYIFVVLIVIRERRFRYLNPHTAHDQFIVLKFSQKSRSFSKIWKEQHGRYISIFSWSSLIHSFRKVISS